MRKVDPTGRTPPCSASPFKIAPMACSRMPKCTLRAPQPPAATSPPFLNTTLVEAARSADPPSSSGTFAARAFRTLPDAARVACASLGVNSGSPSSQPSGSRPAVGVVLRLPLGFEAGPPLLRAAPLRQTCVRDVERLEAGPTQLLLGEPHLLFAERGAVGLWGVLLVGTAEGDVGAHDHE